MDAAEPAMTSLLLLRYGRFCEENGMWDRADSLYRQGLGISAMHRNMEFRIELLWRLSELAHKAGNEQKSLDYYRQFKQHADDVSVIRKEQEFSSLQLLYQKEKHNSEMRVKELDLLGARRNVEYVVMLCLIVLAAAVSVFVWVRRQNKMYRTLVTQYRSYIHRLKEISESRKETEDETTKEDAQYKKLLLRIESLMNTEKCYRDKDMSIYRAQILKMDTNEDMEGNS